MDSQENGRIYLKPEPPPEYTYTTCTDGLPKMTIDDLQKAMEMVEAEINRPKHPLEELFRFPLRRPIAPVLLNLDYDCTACDGLGMVKSQFTFSYVWCERCNGTGQEPPQPLADGGRDE